MQGWYGLVALVVAAVIVAVFARSGGGDLADPRVQLRAVKRAEFSPRPILNRSEFARFRWLEDWARGREYRVFAQVPYGEVLSSPDRDAFRSINSKRADMLIVDGRGLPVLAVEYQGEGHWRGDARQRDAVKRAALAAAGVALLEIEPGHSRAEVIAEVEAVTNAR